jgi:hypothetical protein
MNHLPDMKEAEQKLSNSRTCAVTNSDQTSAFEMRTSHETNPILYCT